LISARKAIAVIATLAFAGLALVAVRILRPGPDTKTHRLATDVTGNGPVSTPGEGMQIPITATSAQPRTGISPAVQPSPLPNDPLPPGRNLQEQLEDLARQKSVSLTVLTQEVLTQFSNALTGELNGPIQFYGKVLDEKDAPVAKAIVAISCYIFPEKQVTTNVITDASGGFAVLNMTGQALTAHVSKEGFEEVPGTSEHHFVFYGIAQPFRPDSNRPVAFRMRAKSSEQK
jgi:hypothetical protein